MRRLLPLALPLALFACADATPTLVDAPEPTPGLDGALPDRWAPPADLAFPDQAFDLGPEMGADASPHGDPCQPAEVPPELPNERLCDPRRPDCPEGYECRQLRNAGADTAYVCAPPACIDRDGDGYGAGADCAGMDCNDCDVSTHAGAAERCDGFDNDCDGQIDEGLDPRQAPADLPCGGPGVCADDTVECVEGQWTCRRSPHWQPDELRCDNLDNDCNGVVDDIEGRGEACSAGEGPCRREGVLVCNGVSGELDCTANPDQPQPERCNGIDDDCNGVVDDVAEAGTRCELGEGACAAIGEWLCNPAQQRLFCSARPAMPADEICDGRDNDCDGEVDEGQGLCPDPVEQCNGLDDDGDGRIDGHTRPCESACGAGNETCVSGVWGACDAPQPAPERCNQRDDDCDGQMDEGACAELCNGLDDDGNGRVDDGLTRPCESACGAGDESCTNGAWGACDAPRPQAEVCNQRDDDCDGQVDEGVQNACGGCGAVQEVCANNRDDDCDGEIDECPVCEGRPDGTVLDTSPWSECQGYTDVCDETGERTRTRQVCQGGQPRQVEDREACQGRDTDGAVQAVGGLSACAGFAGECGEQGTRTRTVSLCRNGQLRDEAEEQACERQTEGDVVDIGAWGACDYADPCDEQAQQRREQQICRGGVARFEEESRACNRDTDGQLVAQGAFGLCGGYSHDCDETGTRERTLDVCRNGRASREIAQDACRRNTDGAGCDFGDGQCQNERCVPICPDNDGDGHQDRACGGDDCDDNDRYKHPGRREVVDVRDNDCDGRSDEGTTVTMRRFHKHWGNNDSSHKFASFQPAGYQPDGRWVEWFEVANDFCDTRHAPENDHPDNRCISQDGGAWVQLWGGYTLTAYAECEGVLGVNNVVLYLPETGLEYQDYRRNGPLLCRRVAYVYGGNSHRDAIDKEQFFRHRSRFGVGEMGTNMWSVDEDEVRAPWVTDPSFWTRGGGMDYPN